MHTPGPWEVKHEYNVFHDGRCVASCGGYQTTTNAEENHLIKCANARLISAAPDLLAALKGVVRVADRATDEFDAARAAIAKALGNEGGG